MRACGRGQALAQWMEGRKVVVAGHLVIQVRCKPTAHNQQVSTGESQRPLSERV